MKNIFKLSVVFLLAITIVSCANNTAQDTEDDVSTEAVYNDGTYTAVAEDYSNNGYRDEVTITIQKGQITSVDYNGYTENGLDKKSESYGGGYDMSVAGSKSPWFEQAKSLEDNLVKTQDVDSVILDNEGYTDAVAGVSIKAEPFVELVNEALEQAVKK